MIDPATIDMMQHMSRQPPAIVQAIAPSPRGLSRASIALRTAGERDVRAVESEVDRWVAAGAEQFAALARAYDHEKVGDHHLAMLARMISVFEEVAEHEAMVYRRIAKKARRLEKQLASALSADDVRLFIGQRDRVLNPLARWGSARWEMIFALRALYAQHHPSGRRGTVFDDARRLGDYLRAAVA